MTPNRKDIEQVIDDLRFVKQAIAKNNSILKFIALSRILGVMSLVGGLLITAVAGAYYLLIRYYGSYAGIPSRTRALLAVLIVIFSVFIGAFKIWRILAGARRVRADYTLLKLVRELYSSQVLLVFMPFLFAGAGVVGFLAARGMTPYLVPALAVLFGLLFNALVGVFYIKELIVGGDWLIAGGVLTLFMTERLHPLLALILTFGLGLIALFVAGWAMASAERAGADG